MPAPNATAASVPSRIVTAAVPVQPGLPNIKIYAHMDVRMRDHQELFQSQGITVQTNISSIPQVLAASAGSSARLL